MSDIVKVGQRVRLARKPDCIGVLREIDAESFTGFVYWDNGTCSSRVYLSYLDFSNEPLPTDSNNINAAKKVLKKV